MLIGPILDDVITEIVYGKLRTLTTTSTFRNRLNFNNMIVEKPQLFFFSFERLFIELLSHLIFLDKVFLVVISHALF